MKTPETIQTRIDELSEEIKSLDKQITTAKTFFEGSYLSTQQESLLREVKILEWVLQN